VLPIFSERPSEASSDHATARKHRNGLDTMEYVGRSLAENQGRAVRS